MPYKPSSFQIPALYYTTLFEAMPGHCVLVQNDAPRYTILAATPAYLQQTGYTKDTLIGKGVFEAFPVNTDPDHTGGSELLASYNHVLLHKEPHFLPRQRYDLQNEDGSFTQKYWKVSNTPVFAPDGEVAYIIHAAEDITEQVQAGFLKEKMKGIEQAHHIFLQAPVVIGILRGAAHTIELVNEDALQFWNKSAGIVGQTLLQAIPELEGQEVYEKIDQVFHTGKRYQASAVPITAVIDGKEVVRYFDLYYKPYYDEGSSEVSGVFTISSEVTDKVLAQRKAEESEDRFRVLADQTPMMVFMADTQAAVSFWNKYWLQYTGQTFAQALGRAWEEVVHPDDYEPLLNTYRQATAAKESYSLEVRMRRWDGTYRYFLFTGGPRYASDGTFLGNIGTGVDVHDRKEAEEALKKSEQNLRNTILQSPVAMAILRGPAYVVEIANDRMYELWGRRKEELVGKSIFEGLPEVRHQGYEDLLNGVFTTGERFTAFGIPVTLPRNNTLETVYINLLYEAYREGDGTISGIIAVATDVTEQIRAQKKLEETEVILQRRVAERTEELEKQKGFIANILEASLDGIYALKAVRNSDGIITDFQYLFANHNTATLLHRSTTEIFGASMLTLIPENRNNGFFDLFCTVLESGQAVQDETHFVAQSINSWYRYVIVPLDQDTVVVTTEDITEKKLAILQIEEQRNLLNNILKNSSNGISVSRVFRDDQGQVIDALTILANDAAAKYIGLPKDIYLSKKATEIEPAVMGSPYYQACIKTLETGEPFVMQYQMASTKRWLELTVSRLDTDHLIQIFTDVTLIKESQLRLEGSVEELKRSNQNLEEFAYAASHDMKEPIRKIHFFSDRLKQQLSLQLTDEQHRLFDRMENAAHRMGTLIEDLLTYSHVSGGATHLETVDLNKKVHNVLEDLELEVEQKQARITVDRLPSITAHKRQMQQLFYNLLGNALKYSNPDVPPEIHLTAKLVAGHELRQPLIPTEADKKFYLIEVRDNGIGFDQQDAERIFTMFTRLHGNAEYRGTGVGLSIAQKVVQNHGGYIWAESTQGEGSSFFIVLPIN